MKPKDSAFTKVNVKEKQEFLKYKKLKPKKYFDSISK